ncbi:MAG TPA: PorV/PorQ family protein [Gemmatimonadaceae bacterium]|nr:PorV/PorQ family protein [Gemmatimonadaceae bacterium]
MRLRLSSCCFALLAALTAPAFLGAQTETGSEGALFLLLPTGAQAVGMGQAMVASRPGSEAIWWNPSALARQEKRELAIHHSKTLAGVGDALSFVLPSQSFGTAALSLNILNIGEQQVTDEQGQPIGVILPRDLVFAGTYAARIGKNFNAGFNYKLVQFRVDCSGQCASVGTLTSTSSAADIGAQYHFPTATPLTIGFALRNFGSRLNSGNAGRSEPLPTQLELGAMYRLGFIDRYLKDTEVRTAGSFVDSRSFGGRSLRVGADVIYQKTVHFRGGYVGEDDRADASASLGFGLESGRFVFDFARTFGGLPADDGQRPTYLSLRYLF